MTIWGNHSATQYPDLSHAEVARQASAKSLVDARSGSSRPSSRVVQQRGAAVIKARGASSAASAASAAIDHVHTWLHGTPAGDWVSMAVPSDGSYGIPAGRHLLLPGHGAATATTRSCRDSPSMTSAASAWTPRHAELREERDGVKTLLG